MKPDVANRSTHDAIPPPGEGSVPLGWQKSLASFLESLVSAIPRETKVGLRNLAERSRDPEFRSAIRSGVAAFVESIEQELAAYERDPHSFLYDEMLADRAFAFISAVREQGEGVLIDALDVAVADDTEFHTLVIEAAAMAGVGIVQRQRLQSGFELLASRSWVSASDLLMKALEGMLWAQAIASGVINEKRQLIDHPRAMVVKGPNNLLAQELPHLRPSLERYLDRKVFDAVGHDIRHGRRETGHRAYALLATAGIVGWLDRYSEVALVERLADQMVAPPTGSSQAV